MTREEAIAVLQIIKPAPRRADGKSTTHTLETTALDMAIEALKRELMAELWPPVPRVANYGGIQDLIKQLQDLILIYGDNKIVLTITDGESEYRIKDITGKQCAQYFEPSDNVSEAIIRIRRK